MNRLNSEGHDESQYLPKVLNIITGRMEQLPPVNAFRAAKGDIIRNEDDKLESISWLPRILLRQGTITKELFDTSRSFERLFLHARKTLGICDINGKLDDAAMSGSSAVDENTDVFLQIVRTIARPELHQLIWLVLKDFPCTSVALPMHMLGVIKHGLQNVQEILDANTKRRNNATSASPELRPDFAPIIP